jgi:hypothetical protein
MHASLVVLAKENVRLAQLLLEMENMKSTQTNVSIAVPVLAHVRQRLSQRAKIDCIIVNAVYKMNKKTPVSIGYGSFFVVDARTCP